MDDSYFARPFVELDEWRDEPVRHRHVHGGFENTETEFSFSFPPAEEYEGRFLHHIEGGGGGTPRAQPGDIALACAYGGYLVVSNQGHMGPDATHLDREIHHYGASVASARRARTIAAEMYGDEPHHGYIWGGSGGAGRTIAILEHAPDLYQGAVVYILPHVAQQVLCAAVANAARVLGDALERVIDATAPGGSGDPFAGLTTEQREALGAVYKLGFPRGAEDQIYPVSIALNGVVPGLVDFDPAYFDDFWTAPGYGGTTESVRNARIQSTHAVRRVLTAAEVVASPAVDAMDPYQYLAVAGIARITPAMPIGVVIEGLPARDAAGAWLTVQSGAAKDRELISLGGGGDVIVAAGGRRNMSIGFEDVAAGDEIAFDNSNFLAYSHFTRHQHEDYPEFATFTVDGSPIYPQRESATGSPDLYLVAPYHGAFDAKCIVVQNLHDGQCWPCGAENLRRQLVERRGSERYVRVWFTEHAMHLPSSALRPGRSPVASTRLIDYAGHVQQAIRDVIDWVEFSKVPPADTAVDRSADGAIVLPDDAAQRQGIQPVVHATANGAARADVRVGEAVRLQAEIASPPGGGRIVAVEWDFDGSGTWPVVEEGIDGSQKQMDVDRRATYDTPGTYFPCVRVTAHRDGDSGATQRRLVNLGRVRVVVTA
ncbi:MAG: hypothetical protein WD271_04100 [Acidimicrobiia bacterium]